MNEDFVARLRSLAGDANTLADDMTVFLRAMKPVVAPVGSAYPPTMPFPLPPTPGSWTITFNWAQSCAKYDGANVGRPVTTYPWMLDTTQQTALASLGSNVLGAWTTTNVGSASPAPVVTRQGVDFDLSSGGTSGLEGVADQFGINGWTYSALPAISAQVSNILSPDAGTEPANYGGAGPMLRDTSAAGSKFVAFFRTVNGYIYAKWRGTTDSTVSYQSWLSADPYLLILPSGTSLLLYSWDGLSVPTLRKTLTSSDVSLASTGIAGCFCFSLSANALSASFRNVTVSPATLLSSGSVAATTTRVASITATDGVNTSAASTISGAPTSAFSTKEANGLWPRLNLIVPKVSDTSGWSNLSSQFANVAATHPEGISLTTYWGVMEGATQGDYTSGDAVLAALKSLAESNGVKIEMEIWPRQFSSGSLPATPQSSSRPFVPDYILSGGFAVAGTYIQSAKLWLSNVNDAWIALWNHIAGVVDTKAWLHTLITQETSDETTWSGYNFANQDAQWKRFISSVKPNLPHTGLRWQINFYGESWTQTGVNQTRDAVEYCYQQGCDIGGPDMYTHHADTPSWGEAIVRGLGNTGSAGTSYYGFAADFGIKQYFGLMDIVFKNEFLNNDTRETLQNYSLNVIKNTKMCWSVNYSGETSQTGWPIPAGSLYFGSSGFKAYWDGLTPPKTVTGCPANRGICSTSWGS